MPFDHFEGAAGVLDSPAGTCINIRNNGGTYDLIAQDGSSRTVALATGQEGAAYVGNGWGAQTARCFIPAGVGFGGTASLYLGIQTNSSTCDYHIRLEGQNVDKSILTRVRYYKSGSQFSSWNPGTTINSDPGGLDVTVAITDNGDSTSTITVTIDDGTTVHTNSQVDATPITDTTGKGIGFGILGASNVDGQTVLDWFSDGGLPTANSTPDQFSFTNLQSQTVSTEVTSAAVTLTAISDGAVFSVAMTDITGSPSGQYEVSLDGGSTWSTAATSGSHTKAAGINPQIRITVTTSSSPNTIVTTECDIEGITANFSATTSGPSITGDASAAEGETQTLTIANNSEVPSAVNFETDGNSVSLTIANATTSSVDYTIPADMTATAARYGSGTISAVMASATASKSLSINEPTGKGSVFIGASFDPTLIPTTGDAVAEGDYLLYDNTLNENTHAVSIIGTGEIQVDSDTPSQLADGLYTFEVQFYDESDGTWGTEGTITYNVGGVASIDSTPNATAVQAQTGITVGSVVTFTEFVITGADAGVDLIYGVIGASAEMRVNSGGGYGAWSTDNQTVQNGYTIQVRHTASSSYGTQVATAISQNGVITTFTSTTEAADAPVISAQPQSVTVQDGESATFTVTTDDTAGAHTYQWNRAGVAISGATSASYTFTPLLQDSGTQFNVTVSRDNVDLESAAAIITVTAVEGVDPFEFTPPHHRIVSFR